MSRRKARKPQRRRQGRVFVQTLHGDKVLMPNTTVEQYDRVKALAEAGNVHAPEIMRFIRAFSALIGHDFDAVVWTDADTWAFLKWIGLVDEAVWTGLEDAELALLLQGGAPDVR